MKSLKIVSLVTLLSMGGQVFGMGWFGSKFSNLFGRSFAKQQVARKLALGSIAGGASRSFATTTQPEELELEDIFRYPVVGAMALFDNPNQEDTMRELVAMAQKEQQKYCVSWGEWFWGIRKSSANEVHKCEVAKKLVKLGDVLSTMLPKAEALEQEMARCGSNQRCLAEQQLKFDEFKVEFQTKLNKI